MKRSVAPDPEAFQLHNDPPLVDFVAKIARDAAQNSRASTPMMCSIERAEASELRL
jgi:hypothetical protein